MEKEIGIYVHIPFCKQKCFYCDFCSYSGEESKIEEYFKYLSQEIVEVGQTNKMDYQQNRDKLLLVKTIYIGGGTPSYVDSKYIKEIMKNIYENFEVNKDAEITIEVNPGTVTEQKLQDYIEAKINRLSIGLQSTNNERLKQIGRIHTFEQFLETYKMASEIGFKNINVDFIIGLPNQTIEEIEREITEIVQLKPQHISVYSLIIEEGTVIEQQLQKGIIALPSDELEREMYWKVKKLLEQSGYCHYEISNYAIKRF